MIYQYITSGKVPLQGKPFDKFRSWRYGLYIKVYQNSQHQAMACAIITYRKNTRPYESISHTAGRYICILLFKHSSCIFCSFHNQRCCGIRFFIYVNTVAAVTPPSTPLSFQDHPGSTGSRDNTFCLPLYTSLFGLQGFCLLYDTGADS